MIENASNGTTSARAITSAVIVLRCLMISARVSAMLSTHPSQIPSKYPVTMTKEESAIPQPCDVTRMQTVRMAVMNTTVRL